MRSFYFATEEVYTISNGTFSIYVVLIHYSVGWVGIDRNAISRLLHLTMVALGPLEPKTKEKMNLGHNRFQHQLIEI